MCIPNIQQVSAVLGNSSNMYMYVTHSQQLHTLGSFIHGQCVCEKVTRK